MNYDRAVITGIGRLSDFDSRFVHDEVNRLAGSITQVKLSHDIEKAAVLSASNALKDASISSPLGDSRCGIFAGIDEGIDSIKFEYYKRVLREGPVGASPLLFPFTSPNAVSAQMAIAFDIRGECITISNNVLSSAKALGYASECINMGKADIAVAGGAIVVDDGLKEVMTDIGSGKDGGHLTNGAAFLVLESRGHAISRGTKIYGEIIGHFEMSGISSGKDVIGEVLSACNKNSGIIKGGFDFICVVSNADDAFYYNHDAKVFKPYSLSASFAMTVADCLMGDIFKGKALFICSDKHGNVAAMLILKGMLN